MKYIFLIRHAETDSTNDNALKGDPALSEKGKKNAELAGKYLQSNDIDAIYTSPFKRTRQTAKIIKNTLEKKIPLLEDHNLREKMEYVLSPFDNFEDFLKEWCKTLDNRKYKPVQGDSSVDTGNRYEQVIQSIPSKFNKIVIVGHGGGIADLIRNLMELGVFDKQHIEKLYPGFWQIREKGLPYCSITALIMENGKYVDLQEVGSIKHLF